MADTVTRHASGRVPPGGTTPPNPPATGPVLFARYAFPPNHLGYCGPDDTAAFLRSGANEDEAGLRAMAPAFDGALPFLRLIAAGAGLADELDARVVEAYWIGSPLLEQASSDQLPAEARAHHSYTVLTVYPWSRMLPDERRRPQALTVLDRCRIRPGRVLAKGPDHLVVESRPLVWADGLALGAPATETVRRSIDGIGLASPVGVGDRVSLHWDWLCDVISAAQQQALEAYNARHLDLTNARLESVG